MPTSSRLGSHLLAANHPERSEHAVCKTEHADRRSERADRRSER